MGRYLDLAKQAMTGGDLSDKRVHGLTLADLREEAGGDWQAIEADRKLLDTFARAVLARRIRERGEVPAHYTATTACAHCGPVPIFDGCPSSVQACPWCANRIAGRPMPFFNAETGRELQPRSRS